MYCRICHQLIENDSIYCKHCGAKQITEQNIKYIFAYKNRNIYKESGLPEDSSFGSHRYFLNEKNARKFFERKYSEDIYKEKLHPEYTIHPILPQKSDGFNTYIDEIDKGSFNLLDNLVEYYDEYHQYNGKTWHDRHELYAVKCIPAFTINPNIKNERRIAFVYEEYVVLNDSNDNFRGYDRTEKVFSDSDAAIQQLHSDFTLFTSKLYNATSQKIDKRAGFDFYDDWALDIICYYSIWVLKDGHRIRRYSVQPVVLY